mmetsp:Transcript_48064/g.107911  ORF Transcript_48064/g.107911 Transcript_48064/m.107911 type:complete len:490 (+) Transcript_48064:237-1706(+)
MTGELRKALTHSVVDLSMSNRSDWSAEGRTQHAPELSCARTEQRTDGPQVAQSGTLADACQAPTHQPLPGKRKLASAAPLAISSSCPRQVKTRKTSNETADRASKVAPQQAARRSQVHSKQLLRSLETLSKVLKDLPREVRRERIRSLDQATRKALEAFMQARVRGSVLMNDTAAARIAVADASNTCREANTRSILLQNDLAAKAAQAVSSTRPGCLSVSGMMENASKKEPDCCINRREYTHLQRNRNGLYRAKTTVSGVTIYGTYVTWPLAMEQRVELMKIRDRVLQAANEMENDGDPRDLLRHAALGMDYLRLEGFKAHVTVCAWDWLGKKQVTSPIVDLEEALRLRSQLWQAKAEGWAAFRAVWLQLLLDPRHPPRHKRSQDNAEAYVDHVIRTRHQAVAERKREPCRWHGGQGTKRRGPTPGKHHAKQVASLLHQVRQEKKMEAMRARLERAAMRVQSVLGRNRCGSTHADFADQLPSKAATAED